MLLTTYDSSLPEDGGDDFSSAPLTATEVENAAVNALADLPGKATRAATWLAPDNGAEDGGSAQITVGQILDQFFEQEEDGPGATPSPTQARAVTVVSAACHAHACLFGACSQFTGIGFFLTSSMFFF